VVTNARVEKINDTTVVYNVKDEQDPNNREKHELPYGFCLWSTGIGKFSASKTHDGREPVAPILTTFLLAMTPFSRSLSEKLEAQKNQRALVTDGYLRLKGIPDGSVYAIGDCATIENPKLLSHIMEIFETADRYV
jgi:NADH dehydrogenase